jgi:hypothetical protein
MTFQLLLAVARAIVAVAGTAGKLVAVADGCLLAYEVVHAASARSTIEVKLHTTLSSNLPRRSNVSHPSPFSSSRSWEYNSLPCI